MVENTYAKMQVCVILNFVYLCIQFLVCRREQFFLLCADAHLVGPQPEPSLLFFLIIEELAYLLVFHNKL
jgi:hypothetical protein